LYSGGNQTISGVRGKLEPNGGGKKVFIITGYILKKTCQGGKRGVSPLKKRLTRDGGFHTMHRFYSSRSCPLRIPKGPNMELAFDACIVEGRVE